MDAGCAYRVLHLFSLSSVDSILELLAVRSSFAGGERIFSPTYFKILITFELEFFSRRNVIRRNQEYERFSKGIS